jgi:membrane protein implicated in regulation of membrane protease activity
MTFIYLASFIGGLLLAVRVMISGVERPREEASEAERSFRLSPATASAFGVIFGAAGYLLNGWTATRSWIIVLVAAALGAVAALIAARLVNRWWLTTPESDVDDERYVLQGHIARVTKAIGTDVDGEVAYELGTRRYVLRARSFDSATLSVGTDVVIERIEGDVAYVEAWMEVEKRL